MTISINLWILRNKQYDGIALYCINLFQEVIVQNPEIQFQLLLPMNYEENFFDFPNVKQFKIFPPLRHPLLYLLWLEIVLPIFFLIVKTDLFIGADGMLSLLSPIKQIPIIYDLNFHHFPEVMDRKNRWFYNLFFPKYAKKAYQIITISNFCKQDIALTYKIDLKDIHVVYANANIIGEILDEDIKNSIKKQYANGFDYFFFVGSLLPRKNLTNQILAFLKFKEKTNSNYKLLISGNSLWGANEILKTIQENNFNNDIIFLGRLKDTELKNVLGAAFALCYASKFEGFGIPIVESFLSGVPVITSNTSSMPEIANNAAVLVNPDNIDDIAEAMNLLYIDDSLRKELILKGLVRAKDFSWTNNAQSFSKIISSS